MLHHDTMCFCDQHKDPVQGTDSWFGLDKRVSNIVFMFQEWYHDLL